MGREERQQLLELAKAKRRARDATGLQTSPSRRMAFSGTYHTANEAVTAKLEQELAAKTDEASRVRTSFLPAAAFRGVGSSTAFCPRGRCWSRLIAQWFSQWRQAVGSLREEQRHLGLEVARLGRENEQLQKEIARRNQDTDALLAETALKEREMRRADTYAQQAAERLEQLHRTEQRLSTAEAALAHLRKEAAASKLAADSAAEQLTLVGVVGTSASGCVPSRSGFTPCSIALHV